MDFLKQLSGEGRALWQGLPGARKLVIVLVTLAAASALSWVALRQYRSTVDPEVASGVGPGGGAAPSENGSAMDEVGDPTLLDIVKPSLIQNQRIVEIQVSELKRLRMIRSILWNPRIADANLEVHKDPKPRQIGRSERGSASIQVSLAPGVAKLSTGEVRSICSTVRDAYDLERDRVTLMDNHGHDYSRTWVEDTDSHRDYHREKLWKSISELCSQSFEPGEFTLFIDVKVQTVELETGEGGLGTQRSEEVASASVILRFEREAVHARFGDEAEFKRNYQEAIETLLGSCERSVIVQVIQSRPVAAIAKADSLPPVPPVERPRTASPSAADRGGAEVFFAWLKEIPAWLDQRVTSAEGIAGMVSLGVVAFLVWSFLGRRRRRTTLPQRTRPAKTKTAKMEQLGEMPTVKTGLVRHDSVEAANPDAFLGAIERTSGWVNEHPQAAASVLRIWLAQDEDSAVERVDEV